MRTAETSRGQEFITAIGKFYQKKIHPASRDGFLPVKFLGGATINRENSMHLKRYFPARAQFRRRTLALIQTPQPY